MTTAEKLTKVAEGLEKTQELNTDLEKIINGGDTGYKSHYDRFWDTFQQNGNRTSYAYAFCSSGPNDNPWNDELFKPKYDINTVGTDFMFRCSKITNIRQALIDCGVKLTFNTPALYYTFYGSTTTHIPDLGDTPRTNLQNAFASCTNLVSIGRLPVSETCSFASAFIVCTSLEDVIFDGVIGKGDLNLRWSTKLSKASITSIINALSTTTSNLTVTLSKTAVNNAFTTDEWNALVATKTNWTISLV